MLNIRAFFPHGFLSRKERHQLYKRPGNIHRDVNLRHYPALRLCDVQAQFQIIGPVNRANMTTFYNNMREMLSNS